MVNLNYNDYELLFFIPSLKMGKNTIIARTIVIIIRYYNMWESHSLVYCKSYYNMWTSHRLVCCKRYECLDINFNGIIEWYILI
jgi:hypothetical protein